jgi:hypothetical protein
MPRERGQRGKHHAPHCRKTNWILTPGKLTEASRITSARKPPTATGQVFAGRIRKMPGASGTGPPVSGQGASLLQALYLESQ